MAVSHNLPCRGVDWKFVRSNPEGTSILYPWIFGGTVALRGGLAFSLSNLGTKKPKMLSYLAMPPGQYYYMIHLLDFTGKT